MPFAPFQRVSVLQQAAQELTGVDRSLMVVCWSAGTPACSLGLPLATRRQLWAASRFTTRVIHCSNDTGSTYPGSAAYSHAFKKKGVLCLAPPCALKWCTYFAFTRLFSILSSISA